ncbi:uncharacterized protein LOC130663664 [Microplitis mediator]|uniref:uncharacterized protein LOC130663664 n=1 Tax=Microplitis mediator TaxID=375433 RepID=UPI0025577BA9|nr:uncharacterized protein LOC130663664 [Microplitis mediator]XP_057319008.1 uncharacterized protein LOC130663664 [Microplitis mediator]XP_057319009.1 uncharacterized protein LOC130663664 [Microplitis mediator]
MNLQWALITLTILAWWSHANAGRLARPDCERFVFHPHCRGTQAKKRVITDPTAINSNIKDSNAERLCICKYLTKSGKRDLLAITKLLETMLANGVDVNMLYDAYSNMGLLSNKDGNDNLRSTHRTNQLSRNSDNVDYNKPDIDLDY